MTEPELAAQRHISDCHERINRLNCVAKLLAGNLAAETGRTSDDILKWATDLVNREFEFDQMSAGTGHVRSESTTVQVRN